MRQDLKGQSNNIGCTDLGLVLLSVMVGIVALVWNRVVSSF